MQHCNRHAKNHKTSLELTLSKTNNHTPSDKHPDVVVRSKSLHECSHHRGGAPAKDGPSSTKVVGLQSSRYASDISFSKLSTAQSLETVQGELTAGPPIKNPDMMAPMV